MKPRRLVTRTLSVRLRASFERVSRRSLFLGATVGIPVSAAFLFLSLRHVDAEALRTSLRGADSTRLAAAACVMWLVYAAQAARWRAIAGASDLSVALYARWVVGSIAVNNLVPGRPGELLRAEWLARATGFPRARALATVVVDRLSDVLVLVAALAVAYPLVDHPPWLNRLGVAVAVAAPAVGVVLAAAFVLARRRLRIRIGAGQLVFAGLSSLSAWAAWAAAAWLVASALHVSLGPLDLLLVTAVLNLGVALPSSPGFIGTYQWLSVAVLGVVGVGHSEAFAFSVLLHAVWYLPTTAVGALLALRAVRPAIRPTLPLPTPERHAA